MKQKLGAFLMQKKPMILSSAAALIATLLAVSNARAAAPLAATAAGSDGTTASNGADKSSSSKGDAEKTAALQEVIVTAQRRKEPLQRTPVSVAAFNSRQLAAVGATSTEDIPFLVPGVNIQRLGEGESIFIRGLGDGGSVLRYVDGVLQVFNGGLSSDLANLQSVEVDKGPQGTLFGRNATGGVVQFTTREPTRTPTLDATVGYGNYQTSMANIYASSALGPDVKSNVSIYANDQHQGWGTNLATGKTVYNSQDFNAWSTTEWTPTSTFDAKLLLQYQYSDYGVGSGIGPAVGIPFIYNIVTGTKFVIPGKYNVDSSYDPFAINRSGIAALQLDKSLGFAKLKSITSYQETNSFLHLDYAGIPIPVTQLQRQDNEHAWTEELQLLGHGDFVSNWVFGFFYLNSNDHTSPYQFAGLSPQLFFGAPATVKDYNINAYSADVSYAAYGQATFVVLPKTKMTLGARITDDEVSAGGFIAYGSTPLPGTSGNYSEVFRRPSFRVVLDHQLAEHLFAYASYNRGYNAGGYNDISGGGYANGLSSVNPETINAYEVGVKSEWFENRLRANVAGFYYDYGNLQEPTFQTTGLGVVNAAAATIKGVDIDLAARPVANLTVTGGLEILDSRYTKYDNAPIYSFAPSGELMATPGSATGNNTVSAPKFGGNVTAMYTVPTAVGVFSTSVGANYLGKWYADASNRFGEAPHTFLNLSEIWTSVDGKTSATVWAKNLTNVYYDAGINLLTPVGVFSEPGAPRTYGVTVTRHF